MASIRPAQALSSWGKSQWERRDGGEEAQDVVVQLLMAVSLVLDCLLVGDQEPCLPWARSEELWIDLGESQV